jgi:hypothetical protein
MQSALLQICLQSSAQKQRAHQVEEHYPSPDSTYLLNPFAATFLVPKLLLTLVSTTRKFRLTMQGEALQFKLSSQQDAYKAGAAFLEAE